jgi:hypothetical protein
MGQMDPNWVIAFATGIQAFLTLVGFVFIYLQLREVKETIQGDAQDSLYTHYLGVLSMLAQKPHLYPYFYENKTANVDAHHPNLRQEVALMSEVILGLVEHSVMFKQAVPGKAWDHCWRPYAKERFKASSELSQFFEKNKSWYAKDLSEVLQDSGVLNQSPANDGRGRDVRSA